MGYFDGLTSGYFKTAQDGRKLYFPWSYWGRGYVMPSDQAYENVRRQLKIFQAVFLVLVIASAGLQHFIVTVAIGVLALLFYAVWSRSLVKGLPVADEQLTLKASQMSRAQAFGPVILWVLEIGALIFVASGLFVLFARRSDWQTGLFATVFFGVCAAVFAYMIVLQRRGAPPRT
jgi:hypothetical protein